MREPLDSFADRLIRSGELVEFLRGLMLEKHVPTDEIILIVQRVKQENVLAAFDYASPGHNDIFSRPFSDKLIPPATL